MADNFQYLYVDPVETGSNIPWNAQSACATGSDGKFDKVPFGTYSDDHVFCSESIDVCRHLED